MDIVERKREPMNKWDHFLHALDEEGMVWTFKIMISKYAYRCYMVYNICKGNSLNKAKFGSHLRKQFELSYEYHIVWSVQHRYLIQKSRIIEHRLMYYWLSFIWRLESTRIINKRLIILCNHFH